MSSIVRLSSASNILSARKQTVLCSVPVSVPVVAVRARIVPTRPSPRMTPGLRNTAGLRRKPGMTYAALETSGTVTAPVRRGLVLCPLGPKAEYLINSLTILSNDLYCLIGGAAESQGGYRLLAYVAIAALGAFCFGFHLGVINGPLSAIAADIGIAGDAAKTGAVVSR
jgi:hypothetical protein